MRAPGDHDPVERLDDLLEVLHRLRLLDLRDHGKPHALGVHDLVGGDDVVGGPHERQRDHVGTDLQGPAEVVDVLVRQRRDADRGAREVEPLVVGDLATLQHPGDDVAALDLLDLEREAAPDQVG